VDGGGAGVLGVVLHDGAGRRPEKDGAVALEDGRRTKMAALNGSATQEDDSRRGCTAGRARRMIGERWTDGLDLFVLPF
jgi:hypothetical protein